MIRRLIFPLLACLAVLPAGCLPSENVTIQGCGSTFVAPLFQRWFVEYYKMHPNVRVNYQPIGSGAGIHQLEEGLVHFAGTDEPKKEEDLKKIAKTLSEREHHDVELLQFPMTAGSIALCYNVPDLPKDHPPLKLTRKAYVNIVLGEITHWDDAAIQSINDFKLPHMQITFVHRADSSGTTFVFTNHLSAVDERWKNGTGLGATKSVAQWPASKPIGGKGNSGVSALIEQTPGAFGYIEAGYAELVNLPIAALENHQGKFVLPTEHASTLGLADAKFNKVLGTSVPDPAGSNDAYPIVSYSWIVCRKHYDDPRISSALKDVLNYCLENKTAGRGQELSSDLGYVALPDVALEKSQEKVKEIETPEGE
jgi:phosphate transport system substrate-binding protein